MNPRAHVKPRSRNTFYALAAALCFMLIAVLIGVAEFQLRRTGNVASYCERVKIPCFVFGEPPLLEPWLFVRKRNSHFLLNTVEFPHDVIGNSEGLPGPDIPLTKQANEFRVIIIGDSFTEGVGARKRKGYVNHLRRRFRAMSKTRHFTVMNAGVAGSDPIYYLELLKHKLAAYKPDLVLMTINKSDIFDVMRRGGKERFDEAGQLNPVPVRPLGWLFEHSHLVRAFFLKVVHYDWNLRTPAESKRRTKMAVQAIVDSGIELRALANKNGFEYFVVIHPYPYDEVLPRKLDPNVEAVEQGLRMQGVSVLNLLPNFLQQIPAGQEGDYYWPIDRHYNEKGYRVFADVLWNELTHTRALARREKM